MNIKTRDHRLILDVMVIVSYKTRNLNIEANEDSLSKVVFAFFVIFVLCFVHVYSWYGCCSGDKLH